MMNRFSPTTLARWTAAFLAISALLFALTVLLEQSGESRESSVASEQSEAAEAGAPTEAGGSEEATTEGEGAHAEGAEGGEEGEEILGVNLENPWLVWGFVAVSLLLAVAVLRFGQPAFLVTILLAGAAALLDVREVFFQFERANMLIAGMALLIALAHAAAAILALMGWLTLRAEGQAASNAK